MKRHALLIGVGNDLPVTVADAEAIYEVLVDPAIAGFDAATAKLLVETAASRQDIADAFADLAAAVGDDADSVVFVFFSGHGVRSGDDYFLIPHDYNRLTGTNGISDAELRDWLAAIKAGRLVMMLDCCFAGGLAKGETPPAGEPSAVPPKVLDLAPGRGIVLVGSSEPGQLSWTGPVLSVFTECLVEGLKGAAAGDDGSVRILRLLSYLFEAVPKRAAPKEQTPFVGRIQSLSGDFGVALVSTGAKGPRPTATSVSASLARAELERLRTRAQNLLGLRTELADQIDVTTHPLDRRRLQADLLRTEATYVEVQEAIGSLESSVR